MGRLPATASFEAIVVRAVSEFGAEVQSQLLGPGNPEDQLRGPTATLVRRVAEALGLETKLYGEVRLGDLHTRPDYQVNVAGAPVGFIEIKRPGKTASPDSYTDPHDREQWQKLKLLPNVLYSDGNEFALYRNGQPVGETAGFNDRVRTAGGKLAPRDGRFIGVLKDFLYWKPEPPRTIEQLVHAVANLCRLLRDEVRTALDLEARGKQSRLFRFLADDWRNLLFPGAPDDAFADHYAQTVTFALLLAKIQGVAFDGKDISAIARELRKKHLLLGKALEVLTDDALSGLGATLETLVHVIGAVDWDRFDTGVPDHVDSDAYLWLYEEFLAIYDPELRMQTGAYYTPNQISRYMIRATDQLLRSRLGVRQGFAAPEVVVVDPAMGTGTFLINILHEAAATIADDEGDESVGPRLRDMATHRLIGFEKQIGPYAVAELRLYDALRHNQSDAPARGLRMYIADTLDSPYGDQTQLPFPYKDIGASREAADRVKRDEPVMVVIGNPPHDKAPKGSGKWIETGRGGPTAQPPLDKFRAPGNGRYEYVLANMYVYFWRWATWKVFDHHEDAPSGVVAFVSPSAYLTSHGFAGMREYLRRTTDEGWIINLSPEGHRPEVATRVFHSVQQPLCIGLFVRKGYVQRDRPAAVHYLAVTGRRQDKFDRLATLTFEDPEWAACSQGWQASFLPKRDPTWSASPPLHDLFPWSSRGVTPGRTWVYACEKETLIGRWWRFVAADREERRELFREPHDRTIDAVVAPLPGITPHTATLAEQQPDPPIEPVLVGHRPFDRKWLLPDHRLMVRPRPDLWRVRGPHQLYMTQSVHPVSNGPALVFTSRIPDMDHYHGRGGRVIPLYRNAAGNQPNLAPKLLPYLADRLGIEPTAEDLLAYVAAIVAHPAYTHRFRDDLRVPGVRIPLTADPALWHDAVQLGGEVLWLHTYGERYFDPAAGRPNAPPRMHRQRRPEVDREISDTQADMPTTATIRYDEKTQTLHIGTGAIKPVDQRVWNYEVSGWRVARQWLNYRKKDNRWAKRPGELDQITPTRWHSGYTSELLNLLHVLGRLVELEPSQAELLQRVCGAPQITVAELNTAGILPPPQSTRKLPSVRGDMTLFDT
jgi:hypothetical protein